MGIWQYLGTLGYHADGTIKRGRQLVGYYYTLDTLTATQLKKVQEHWPDAERMLSKSEYAPERVSPIVFLPSKAERKRRAAAERDNAPSFYVLPTGMSWADVARERRRWDIDPKRYPLASGMGVRGWGVPLAVDFAQASLFA